jgi:hypothetical protein
MVLIRCPHTKVACSKKNASGEHCPDPEADRRRYPAKGFQSRTFARLESLSSNLPQAKKSLAYERGFLFGKAIIRRLDRLAPCDAPTAPCLARYPASRFRCAIYREGFDFAADRPALTVIFPSALRASELFGSVTASRPFLKLASILSLSIRSDT